MTHPFKDLEAEYQGWVNSVRPLTSRIGEIDMVAHHLLRPEAVVNFGLVADKLGIPLIWQAPSFERECGADFSRSPAQGDPWNRTSVHVPKNRGPFGSWYDSAYDAYHTIDHIDDNSAPWSLAYCCWKWEVINGFGYRARGLRSPYVVGGTNLQQSGKYVADGQFDPYHMDGQLGCLPIAMRMIELMPNLGFRQAAQTMAAALAGLPRVAAPSLAVGGDLAGCKWIQASLNAVLHPSPNLIVDGSYGRLTRAAVRQAQELFGLSQNGLVDDALCEKIDNALAAMRPR
jgi:lysozyme family protein